MSECAMFAKLIPIVLVHGRSLLTVNFFRLSADN